MGEHDTNLRVTALEQCAKQAGKQLGLLAYGSGTICNNDGQQKANNGRA